MQKTWLCVPEVRTVGKNTQKRDKRQTFPISRKIFS